MSKRMYSYMVYLKHKDADHYNVVSADFRLEPGEQPTQEAAAKYIGEYHGIHYVLEWDVLGWETYDNYSRALDSERMGTGGTFMKNRGLYLKKRRTTRQHPRPGLQRLEEMHYVEGDPSPPPGTAFTVFTSHDDAMRYAVECFPVEPTEARSARVKSLDVYVWGELAF